MVRVGESAFANSSGPCQGFGPAPTTALVLPRCFAFRFALTNTLELLPVVSIRVKLAVAMLSSRVSTTAQERAAYARRA